mmetsp:Transcript_7634/g.8393  ORF Transcript_7634/g.8393 Transcript_7634/m.8393 type:complete len:283 (+) Transcript_7634:71-919(+)
MFVTNIIAVLSVLLAPSSTAFNTAPTIISRKTSSLYSSLPPGPDNHNPMQLWDISADKEKIVQGDSLKTWSYPSTQVDRVQVSMKTDGRPLNSKIDLWHGPDYTATTTTIYTEDGYLRPYNGVQATPKGMNTVGLYNTGSAELAYSTIVEADPEKANLIDYASNEIEMLAKKVLIQGGAIQSFPFSADVESVAVYMKTDGRNLKCHIEILQGPNNNKQTVEYYASDGYKRPLFTVIKTPGSGNVLRVTNQNTVEYPFHAWVVPYEIQSNYSPYDAVEGGLVK